MKICVIGGGYVGLTTGACLAYVGHKVGIVENNLEKLAVLRSGDLPIYEPGLADIIRECRQQITFLDALEGEWIESDLIIIAVGTPAKDDGDADLTYLFSAVRDVIAKAEPNRFNTIAIKSTVPIGTNELLVQMFKDEIGKKNVSFVSTPEFLREGFALIDTLYPDRIVVGSRNDRDADLIKEAYLPILTRSFRRPHFVVGNFDKDLPELIVTTPTSAEMVKYASNAFLALKVSYINEMAMLCDKVGADIEHVAFGVGTDSRIGRSFLRPGIGWGGSCFPKDTSALLKTGEKHGQKLQIVESAILVNNAVKEYFVSIIKDGLGGLQGKVIALLGLSFKPNTDDVRDSPALDIAKRLLDEGALVRATDPMAIKNAMKVLPASDRLRYCADAYEAVTGADAIVIATEWPEWKNLDYGAVSELVRGMFIFDGRNALDKKGLVELGYRYKGVGS